MPSQIQNTHKRYFFLGGEPYCMHQTSSRFPLLVLAQAAKVWIFNRGNHLAKAVAISKHSNAAFAVGYPLQSGLRAQPPCLQLVLQPRPNGARQTSRYMYNLILTLYLILAATTTSKAQTLLTHINTDTYYENTFLQVNQDITIAPNATLTLGPGCTLQVTESRVTVEGILSIQGTEASPVSLLIDTSTDTTFIFHNNANTLRNFTISGNTKTAFKTERAGLSLNNLTINGGFSGQLLYAVNSIINITDSYLSDCFIRLYSQIFLYIESSTSTIENSTFTNSESSSEQFRLNALKAIDAQITINNATFSNLGLQDGTLQFSYSDISINNSTFSRCVSSNGGGAIKAIQCGLSIIGSEFTQNTAPIELFFQTTVNGGAVWHDGGILLIDSSKFHDNYASHMGGSVCWQAYNQTDSVRITNCEFKNSGSLNVAFSESNQGGACALSPTNKATILNNTFTNCFANAGGAVFVDGASELIVAHNIFTGCATYDEGGALYALLCSGRIRHNEFSSNTSGLVGGGVCVSQSGLHIDNNIFNKNEGYWKGGAIAFQNEFQQNPDTNFVLNNVFYRNGNSVGDASALYSEGNSLHIHNNIFWENGSIYELPPASPTTQIDIFVGQSMSYLTHNIVQYGSEGIKIHLDVDNTGFIFGNVNQDPQFIDPENKNFRIQNTSPAINLSTDLIPVDWVFDSYQNTRLFKDTYADAGVFETTVYNSPTDSLALVALYNATNGPGWKNNTNWLRKPINEWYGVHLSYGRVTLIDLHNNNLQGEVPDAIKNLKELLEINLSENEITSIPKSITDIEGIKFINFNYNALTSVPDLTENQFYHLEKFYVGYNKLNFGSLLPNSSFPNFIYFPQDTIGTPQNSVVELNKSITLSMPGFEAYNGYLVYKWYKDNALIHTSETDELLIDNFSQSNTGTYICEVTHNDLPLLHIPQAYISLKLAPQATNLQDSLALVDLYNRCSGNNWKRRDNWLKAKVSEWQGVTVENTRVTELSLSANNLYGTIPNSFQNLTELKTVDLSNNELYGNFNEILNFSTQTNIEELNFSYNSLTGYIPDNIYYTNLRVLNLTHNKLSDILPYEFPSSIKEILLGENYLSGDIPWTYQFLNYLEKLDLSDNNFSGTIIAASFPFSISYVDLSNNQFSGEFFKYTDYPIFNNIQYLSLKNNLFSGGISYIFWEYFEYCYLSGNQFSGGLPPFISSGVLQELDLSNNNFSGEIPSLLLEWQYKLRYLALSNNSITGKIPWVIEQATSLKTLKLEANQLTGSIPAEITQLDQLEELSLDKNQLTGELPADIEKLRPLRILSVRSNNLSGDIPAGISKLSLLEELVINDNNFNSLPNLSNLSLLKVLQAQNNNFEFDDIIPNINVCEDFMYSPQHTLDFSSEITSVR